MPHLHFAVTRALSTIEDYALAPAKSHKPLSTRQQEILYWMHERKTNWEIAKILELSELNVKYHVEQIFLKLGPRSRAHAIAKAHEFGPVAAAANLIHATSHSPRGECTLHVEAGKRSNFLL